MPKRDAGAKATPTTTKAVEKKSIIEGKVMDYLKTASKDVGYDLVSKIKETAERKIKSPDGEMFTVLFVTFSDNGKEDEEAVGEVQILKDILFQKFSVDDEKPSAKKLLMEVLPPETEGEAFIGYFYQV